MNTLTNRLRWALIASVILLVTATLSTQLAFVHAASEPASPPAGSTLEARVEQRKTEQQVELDTKTTKRIQEQCKVAQPKISQVVDKTDTLITNRVATYQRIDGTLLVAIGKLKLAEKDTFTLEQNRNEFLNKVGVFKTNMIEYRQALDDMVVMNCQADVVGFKAMLETARAYNQRLKEQSEDISLFLVDTVKPVIDDFATQLEPKSESTTE